MYIYIYIYILRCTQIYRFLQRILPYWRLFDTIEIGSQKQFVKIEVWTLIAQIIDSNKQLKFPAELSAEFSVKCSVGFLGILRLQYNTTCG